MKACNEGTLTWGLTILNKYNCCFPMTSVDGGVLHHHLVSVRREYNRGACYMLGDNSVALLYQHKRYCKTNMLWHGQER